jgi:hypothetical protein
MITSKAEFSQTARAIHTVIQATNQPVKLGSIREAIATVYFRIYLSKSRFIFTIYCRSGYSNNTVLNGASPATHFHGQKV